MVGRMIWPANYIAATRRSWAAAALCGWVIVGTTVRAEGPAEARVITTGWHMPTVRQFARDAKFALEGPLDGAGVRVRAAMQPSDPLTKAFTGGRWDAAAFAETEAALDRIDPAEAASSYLVINANPGDADWLDDDVWRDVVDHFQTASGQPGLAAKESR